MSEPQKQAIAFVNTYQEQFGTFISKYNLGGLIPGKRLENGEQTAAVQRLNEIEKSREARAHFFNAEKSKALKEHIDAQSEEEREKIDTTKDEDMVSWYNRTKTGKADLKLKTIPGCFYKVRA